VDEGRNVGGASVFKMALEAVDTELGTQDVGRAQQQGVGSSFRAIGRNDQHARVGLGETGEMLDIRRGEEGQVCGQDEERIAVARLRPGAGPGRQMRI